MKITKFINNTIHASFSRLDDRNIPRIYIYICINI